MEIPSEIIKKLLQEGSVYYFSDEHLLKSKEPHYYIVLNNNPVEDVGLLLAISSSQINKVKFRRRNEPQSTLIFVEPSEYSDFAKPSIIDCNSVRLVRIEELKNKYENKELKLKSVFPKHLLVKLRKGVLDSKIVERSKKRILDPSIK